VRLWNVFLHRHYLEPNPNLNPNPNPAQALSRVRLVVNCLGLGAGAVEGDQDVFSRRGHLVFLYCPDVEDVLNDEDPPLEDGDLTYIVPQENGVVACAGSSELSDNVDCSRAQSLSTMRRCQELLPQLKNAPVIGEWAGLRPARKGGIRIGRAEHTILVKNRGAIPLVYNYGHGGSGVVVSWGCAGEVARISRDIASELDATLRPTPTSSSHLIPPLDGWHPLATPPSPKL